MASRDGAANSVTLAVRTGLFIAASADANGLSNGASVIAGPTLSIAISIWTLADARKRRRSICYDYDAFVYFAWPIVLPVYLIQTRGWRTLITLLCFAGVLILASTAAYMVVVMLAPA